MKLEEARLIAAPYGYYQDDEVFNFVVDTNVELHHLPAGREDVELAELVQDAIRAGVNWSKVCGCAITAKSPPHRACVTCQAKMFVAHDQAWLTNGAFGR